jgi:hypothetical protein
VEIRALAPGAHNVSVTAVDGWSRFALGRAERDAAGALRRRPVLSTDCVSFEL